MHESWRVQSKQWIPDPAFWNQGSRERRSVGDSADARPSIWRQVRPRSTFSELVQTTARALNVRRVLQSDLESSADPHRGILASVTKCPAYLGFLRHPSTACRRTNSRLRHRIQLHPRLVMRLTQDCCKRRVDRLQNRIRFERRIPCRLT